VETQLRYWKEVGLGGGDEHEGVGGGFATHISI
jgi:hypothetical protein